ncbi:multidrug resistance-associated protein 4-like isoform X2 [Stylophora pistillata]|nr:multidrug resistance-associated protein 4-like isoform X2 [Stylophora pistillata]
MSAEPQKNLSLYGCVMAMLICATIGGLSVHYSSYKCDTLGIGMSSALKGLIYRKTLLLGKNRLLRFSTGRVIDLVSNDVQRLEGETVKFFYFMILDFFLVGGATVLLVYFIGWQTLLGVIVLCLLVPYFGVLSYVSAALRLRTAAVSDQRISLMNQAVSGIRTIKTHAWEDEYQEMIKHLRSEEMNIIRKKSAVLAGVAALQYTSVPLTVLVVVITMVLTGRPITPVNLFMLLPYINTLITSICYYQAYGSLQTYEAYASLQRIEEFLLLDELQGISEGNFKEEISRSDRLSAEQGKSAKSSIGDEEEPWKKSKSLFVSGLSCSQSDQEEEFTLENVEFIAAPESLTVFTGPVGSGKSTLLLAIAGEISDISGDITFQGSLAHVSQTPWVFSGTIRQNILFGLPYDETKYSKIIEACSLTEDFHTFPNSDHTVVGERGAVLSGGQRARVSMARAVYMNADLYLLDDPLSAVDMKVGQHIFQRCLLDPLVLGNKTRVLATHQEEHMKVADEVILLHKGRMMEKGSLVELQKKGCLGTVLDPLHMKSHRDGDSDLSSVSKDKGKPDVMEKSTTKEKHIKDLVISEEDRTIGEVTLKTYWEYFRSGLHSLAIFSLSLLCVITQGMIVAPDVWLSFFSKKRLENQREKMNLISYGCLVTASFVFAFIRAHGFLLACLRCSEQLQDKMVTAVLKAPVFFFDSNPVGRILNRFSKDVGCLDELLPDTFLVSVQVFLLLLSSVMVPIVTNPWVLFVVVPLSVVVVYISRYYLKTSRQLKRLESICRSPVYSHISETLNGLETIRTGRRHRDFEKEFYRFQDVHTQSYIMVLASGRWLSVRIELLSSILTGVVALAAILVSQDAAFAGLALVYVIETVEQAQFVVRKTSDVENSMTSVERVLTYAKLDCEPGYKVLRPPPENWPSEGGVTFQNVSLTYYPGGPQVLKYINLDLKGRTKFGVAGRTGAGKSSLVAALLRMPDADGNVIIDGVPIKEINLQEARRCISVLGQNPVLFSGSLRRNLDLVNQFQDFELWKALEDVQLKELVKNLEGQLHHELLEHGSNFSAGERQLICLARVLLQQKKVIILDEPTAQVDPETEQVIWRVVREKLKNSTVITIAHRLNTLKDCDMILVMKNGKVDRFDSFDSLVRNEDL